MRRSIFACGLLLALAGISSAVAAAAGGTGANAPAAATATTATTQDNTDYWNARAAQARAATEHWLTVVHGRPQRLAAFQPGTTSAQAYNVWRTWRDRAASAASVAKNPPKLQAWYCIHSYEGSWSDPNAPYWGGLQMDMNFQSAYGPWLLQHKGTANNWTPLQQIWAGVRAWRVRGFEPWSNTAHACGVY